MSRGPFTFYHNGGDGMEPQTQELGIREEVVDDDLLIEVEETGFVAALLQDC
jgi:hypothetical protein